MFRLVLKASCRHIYPNCPSAGLSRFNNDQILTKAFKKPTIEFRRNYQVKFTNILLFLELSRF